MPETTEFSGCVSYFGASFLGGADFGGASFSGGAVSGGASFSRVRQVWRGRRSAQNQRGRVLDSESQGVRGVRSATYN